MKYLILFIALIMVSNVKASSYDEYIDYQKNALRSLLKETVEEEPQDFSLSDLPPGEYPEDVSYAIPYDKERSTTDKVLDTVQDYGTQVLGGVATNQEEPLDFSLSDLPLSNNTEDVGNYSDYGRYAMKKGFQWDNPFSDESLYVLGMYVSKFLGMAIPWVILFFVLRKYIFYKPKRAEKKNTNNTVSATNVEQTSPTNANEVYDVSKQPQEQTHVFDKGGKKNMNKKINHFFVILFLFIITILVCYWLGYLFSDFTKEFLTIFVKHRNLFSPIGFRVLLSIFMLIGILYLIVYIIYTKKYKKIPLLMSGKTKE